MVSSRDPFPGSILVDGVPVSDSNPLPTTGGGSGGAVTIADGADVALGAVADAAVAAGAAGTISAKLRRVTQALEDLKTMIVAGLSWIATGGLDSYSALSTAAVLNPSIKASAGRVAKIEGFNIGANEVFVRIYNQATAPGTGDAANIIWRGVIPGDAAGAGFSIEVDRQCSAGIGMRVTAGVADNDATALAANEVMINVGYK